MPDTFCISTSTSAYPLQVVVPLSGTFTVQDANGNSYYATTSCPSVVETINNVMDNPAQNLYNGIILFFVAFGFVVWYFMSRLKLR